MIRSRLLSAAVIACALVLLAPPAMSAGQGHAADALRESAVVFAPLVHLQRLFGSLWSTAAALVSNVPPAGGEDADPSTVTGDEGSSLDPHG